MIFETLPYAQLEIHCGVMASAILSDTIPCDRLQIDTELEGDSVDPELPPSHPVVLEKETLVTAISHE